MILLLDENLSPAHALRLRAAGHDALAAVEAGLGGVADAAVRAFAIGHGRILVTLDADFGHVLRYPVEGTPGVIWLRPWPPSESAIELVLDQAVRTLAEIQMGGKLAVAEPGRVRIR